MDDTFFGFDSSIPFEDNGTGAEISEPSEEEYDALNDETFGSATKGDWEAAHENMVRLTDCISSTKSSPSKANIYYTRILDKSADADLEINLSEMKLDDVDLSCDDDQSIAEASGIRLDPGVWSSSPFKATHYQTSNMIDFNCRYQGRDTYRLNSDNGNNSVLNSQGAEESNQFYKQKNDQPNQIPMSQKSRPEIRGYRHGVNDISPTTKFCTLEDIERNIIIEQTMRKHLEQQSITNDQQNSQEQEINPLQYNDFMKQVLNMPPIYHGQYQQPLQQKQNMQKPSQISHSRVPGFSNTLEQPIKPSSNFANNLAQHPLNNLLQHQTCGVVGNRFSAGFHVYPTGLGAHLSQPKNHQLSQHRPLNQHGLPVNFQQLSQRTLPSPHLPIALNNFAMHPNFNTMRATAAVAGIHQAALVQPQQTTRINSHPPSPAILVNAQQSNTMYNMFNMRLVQEIQQNHPLLQSSARQAQHVQQSVGINIPQSLAQIHQRVSNNAGNKTSYQRRECHSNGNLPNEVFDEYANLMSIRDKHWLIGIQLSQLNTDTPYIDDFYYTVYRERSSAKNGNLHHSQAHKDNQLNHPLTQPKGHTQLILVQLGNKNGSRNGQHRERQNSETNMVIGNSIGSVGNNNDQKMPYVFTPLKFENSLGKLQYGSVTAPRKIIDAEIMGNETGDLNNIVNSSDANSTLLKSNTSSTPITGIISDSALSAQRKSRHILLQIEMLYRIVLKLDDLNNPTAIATIILKKKKENERIAALELLENVNKPKEERVADSTNQCKMNGAHKNKFIYEIEKKEILMAKLMASLSYEDVPAIMNVRKGKTLMRRIMPYIEDHEVRWNIWMGIFASLQNVVKKDKDDVDGVLYAFYPEFKKQIGQADFKTIVTISASINLSEKKCNGVFCSKFGISSLVCLVLRAEHIYISGTDITHTDSNKENWRNFLDKVATSLNRTIQRQTICAEIESDSIQPLMNHFARFQDLKLDSLLALITEAKHQIN